MGKKNIGGSAYLALTGRLGSAALSQLFSSESRMSRRNRKGKNQTGNAFDNLSMPDYLQAMLGTGRDSDGNISSKAASRGAGFTDKEIASEYANWAKTQDERAYENQLWQERESIQGQVNQMKNAGLNPALMYGSGASSSGGSPVSSTPTESGSSSYDEFGGSFSILGSILQLLGLGQNVASGVSDMKSQSTQRKNDTAITNANVENTNANTELVRAQTQGQQNLNATFWKSWSVDIANKTADTALKESNIKVNEEEIKAIVRRLEIASKQNDILEYKASTERMQVLSYISLVSAQVANLQKDSSLKESQKSVFDKELSLLENKLKISANEVELSDMDKTRNVLSKTYGVPPEWAFYTDAIAARFGKNTNGFAKWLAGWQKALANRATAIQYAESTSTSFSTPWISTSDSWSSSGGKNVQSDNFFGVPQFD